MLLPINYVIYVVFVVLVSCKQTAWAEITINTDHGPILGSYHDDIAVFKKIPFAKPPVENLRFIKPQDPASWTQTLQCNGDYASYCPQPGYPGSEDCLYLNVFSPNVTSTALLPVMFWIPGGGFSNGGAQMWFDDTGLLNNVVSRDVIVVTSNYRVSVFGFFTTHTADFPANVGLWDQIQALKWVQANIKSFGGDPSRVTIFGQSAGGTSVSLLTYSPAAKGLFQQAIVQSDTAFSPGLVDGIRSKYNPSKDFAVYLGCITANNWDAMNFTGMQACLQSKSMDALLNATMIGVPPPQDPGRLIWVPSVDGGAGNVLPMTPSALASTRNPSIKIMIGNVRDEGFGFYNCLVNNQCPQTFWQQQFPIMLSNIANPSAFGSAADEVSDIAAFLYGGGLKPVEDWLNTTMHLGDGYNAAFATRQDAQYWVDINGTAYLYSFDYISATYPWANLYPAAPHLADVWFIFNKTDPWGAGSWSRDYNDTFMINLMGTFWTNFAKSGDPNKPEATHAATWLPTTSQGEYYSMDSIYPGMRPSFQYLAAHLWGCLVPQILKDTNANAPAVMPRQKYCDLPFNPVGAPTTANPTASSTTTNPTAAPKPQGKGASRIGVASWILTLLLSFTCFN